MSKPLPNAEAVQVGDDKWICGFALALAEVHRINRNSTTICEVARDAGLSLTRMRAAGVELYDWRELRKAGVQ